MKLAFDWGNSLSNTIFLISKEVIRREIVILVTLWMAFQNITSLSILAYSKQNTKKNNKILSKNKSTIIKVN